MLTIKFTTAFDTFGDVGRVTVLRIFELCKYKNNKDFRPVLHFGCENNVITKALASAPDFIFVGCFANIPAAFL